MKMIYEVGAFMTFLFVLNGTLRVKGIGGTIKHMIPIGFTVILWPIYWSVIMLASQFNFAGDPE